MGKKKYGNFIKGSIKKQEIEIENKEAEKTHTNSSFFVDEKGHVTLESISSNREWFYEKNYGRY